MEIASAPSAPAPLTIATNGHSHPTVAFVSTNGKRKLEAEIASDDHPVALARLGCSHVPLVNGDQWLHAQLHATLRRARLANDATIIRWGASEQDDDEAASSSLRRARALCLSCVFSGRREDAVDAAQCFLTHAMLTNHHLALLPREKQLFCARCLDFVYPDALLALTQPPPTPSHHDGHATHKATRHLPSHSHSHSQHRAPSLRRRLMRSSARRGLVNMGNTCFMNAVLQALAHNPLVQHEYFVVRGHDTTICEQKRRQEDALRQSADLPPCMGCEMASLLQTLFPAPRATLTARLLTSPVVPQSFLETFWASAPSFIGSQQQDAHEFLMTLLNAVHKDTCPRTVSIGATTDSTLPPQSPSSPRFSATGQSLCDCVAHQNFAGVFSSEIACVFCDTVSSKYDPFLDVTLSVDSPVAAPRKSSSSASACEEDSASAAAPLSLVSLLERFTYEERLKGANQVYCRRCSRYVDAMKRLVIHRLPNLLVLHLGRFDFAKKRKITDAVTFPLRGLDLREFCSDAEPPLKEVSTPSSKALSRRDAVAAETSSGRDSPMTPPPTPTPHTRDAMYDLAAVVSHHGDSVDGGHFTAFVHSATDESTARDSESAEDAAAAATSPWLHFDDSKVERVPSQRVEDSQAYLLFYVRRRLFV